MKISTLSVFLSLLSCASLQAQEIPVADSVRAKDLAAVTVTGRKPLLEKKTDRTIVNVDALVSAAGTDAYYVMQNIPGVTIDDEGNISLNGRSGVLVIINGKQTYLSGTALVAYLRSLPSSTLEKMELMPVPPAGLDAAGNAGVINIVTKKIRKQGLNGTLNTAINQGILFSTTNSATTNYQTGKFNWFGTASFATGNLLTDLDIERNYEQTNDEPAFAFNQHSYIRRSNRTIGFRGGMDYDIGKQSVLGIGVNLLRRPSSQRTINRSEIVSAEKVDSSVQAFNNEKDKWRHHAININYRKKSAAGHTIGGDADYLSYTSGIRQGFYNTTERTDGSFSTEWLGGWLPSETHIWAAKGDVTHSFSSVAIEAGLKGSFAETHNIADFSVAKAGDTISDHDKSNDYSYREHIHAVYFSLQTNFGKLAIKGGLRMENTVSQGRQKGNPVKPDSTFRRNYLNLFPTLFASYTADSAKHHQFTFSYARRIERPFYQDLNPYVSPLDKFTLYVGNPFLNPSFAHNFSLSYIFRSNITVSVNYSLVNQVFMEAISLDGPHYLSRPDNLGKNRLFTFSVNGSFNARPWTVTNVYIEGGRRDYSGLLFAAKTDTAAWYLGTNIMQQFILPKNWTVELSGNWRTGVLVGQVSLGAIGQLNAAIQKKVMKKQGTVRLAVRDVLYSGIRNGEIHFLPQATAVFRNRADSRLATLSFSWQFGKSAAAKRASSAGSASEEQQRVRQ